jgi:hypothetical protein
VYLLQLDMQRQILKICPFKHQLRFFTQEIKAYNTLSKGGCSLIPRLSAYVFERSEEQIIGFIREEFRGRLLGLVITASASKPSAIALVWRRPW